MTATAKRSFALAIAMVFASALSSSAQAAAEPTMHQIYETANTGHLNQAQEMITQVLANHPPSAK